MDRNSITRYQIIYKVTDSILKGVPMSFLICWLFMLCTSIAQAQQQTKLVAVLEFRGLGVNTQLLAQLSEEARGGARMSLPNSEYNITSRENMKQMLEDMGKDMSACDVECEVELGRVLQADYVISGSVGKIDNMFILTLKLHETERGSLMGQKTIRHADKFVVLDKTLEETKALVIENIALASNQLTGRKVNVTFTSPQFNEKTPTMVMVANTPMEKQCTTQNCSMEVPAGRYNVQFIQSGYAPETQQIDFNQQKNIEIELRPNFANIKVRTEPEDVTIVLRGGPENKTKKETSEFTWKKLAPGKYSITVEDKCYEANGKEITLSAGDDKDISITLQPKQSGISVVVFDEYQEPLAANVLVDGKKVGVAPWQGPVDLCTGTVTAKHGSQKDTKRAKALSLEERKIKELKFTLD